MINHGREMADMMQRREYTTFEYNGPGIRISDQQSTLPSAGTAHIRIMKAKRNAKGAITAITHPNATAEIAMQDLDIIIIAARTVDRGVVDVEENVTWARLKSMESTSCGTWEKAQKASRRSQRN